MGGRRVSARDRPRSHVRSRPGRSRAVPGDARPPEAARDPKGSAARLRALRRTVDSRLSNDVVLATFRFRIPARVWVGPFSERHPTLRLEVLNRGEARPGISVSDCWVSGGSPGGWAQDIRTLPDVIDARGLAEVGDGCLYRVLYHDPPLFAFLQKLGVPLQFPISIQAGLGWIEVVGRLRQIRRITEFARAADPRMEVIPIRKGPLRSHLPELRPNQQELLHRALALGYFAVPRRVTLTELARTLGRSLSGLSQSIAVIERKLLESALTPSSAFYRS